MHDYMYRLLTKKKKKQTLNASSFCNLKYANKEKQTDNITQLCIN